MVAPDTRQAALVFKKLLRAGNDATEVHRLPHLCRSNFRVELLGLCQRKTPRARRVPAPLNKGRLVQVQWNTLSKSRVGRPRLLAARSARLQTARDTPAADDKTVISKRPHAPEMIPPAMPSPHDVGQLLVGKRLEHYDLDEYVGGGGMGAVFCATDSRLGRTIAVKVLSARSRR